MRATNSYHTNYKIKCRLGLMAETESSTIPYITRKGWNNLVLSRIVGYDDSDPFLNNIDFHRKFIQVSTLAKIARGLWFVYRTYALLFEKAGGKKRIIRENFSHIKIYRV